VGALMMRNDSDAILDDILIRWHQWPGAGKVGRGFNNRALVCGDYRTSRQYDDSNGALDDDLENRRMSQVDFEVSQMKDPHRAAIYCLARALVIGAQVFNSPRLPADRAERDAIVRQARALLTNRLLASGVM
jgi:hypothetical protein